MGLGVRAGARGVGSCGPRHQYVFMLFNLFFNIDYFYVLIYILLFIYFILNLGFIYIIWFVFNLCFNIGNFILIFIFGLIFYLYYFKFIGKGYWWRARYEHVTISLNTCGASLTCVWSVHLDPKTYVVLKCNHAIGSHLMAACQIFPHHYYFKK